MNLKKTAIASAIAVTMGLGVAAAPTTASAANVTADWSGLFTILNSAGAPTQNTSYPYYGDPTWGYGVRTQISGSLTFDTSTGSGSATVNPFDFFAGGPAVATTVTMQAIGDGAGGQGTLVLGNMGFNWNGNNGIPVSIVLDAAGFFGALQGGQTTGSISGVGATPASNNIAKNQYPIGPAPMATTTWNTTPIGTVVLGTNPSGTLPLTNDTVGGSPMLVGPFAGFSANFDLTLVSNLSVTPAVVPVPAAVWLFGSGLLGLVGIARRKKQA
jgi:hypothetical protein